MGTSFCLLQNYKKHRYLKSYFLLKGKVLRYEWLDRNEKLIQ